MKRRDNQQLTFAMQPEDMMKTKVEDNSSAIRVIHQKSSEIIMTSKRAMTVTWEC